VTAEVDDRAASGASPEGIAAVVEAVLVAEGAGEAEVGVLLVGADEMRRLNREHRERDEPTDVLAFPIDEGPDDALPGVPRLLGDVVVCVPVLLEQASANEVAPGAELVDLVVHGTLHLLGHDHETDDGTMLRRQDAIVAGLAPLPWEPARDA
jgi:probable rRNA maturation factor